MKRNKKLRNISRVDQDKKRQYGWLVRVMRDGVNHQKFISDSTHGGKHSSLLTAMEFRDDLLNIYPPSLRGNMFNRTNRRNKSGHAGISLTGSWRKGRYYAVWQAGWLDPRTGIKTTRKFGFSETGRSELAAKRLAIKTRREALEAMAIQMGVKSP